MNSIQQNSIAQYFAAWNTENSTVHLRTANNQTALCGFEITDLTNVAYEPIGASVDMPNLNSLCTACATIAQTIVIEHTFKLSEYVLQKNDIIDSMHLINSTHCKDTSYLHENLRKKLFDVRVQKWTKRPITVPAKTCNIITQVSITVDDPKEPKIYKGRVLEEREFKQLKRNKATFATMSKYGFNIALERLIRAFQYSDKIPFLFITVKFEIVPIG